MHCRCFLPQKQSSYFYMMMHDVHINRLRLKGSNQYKCHSIRSWASTKAKTLQSLIFMLPPVATYPSAGGQRETHGYVFHGRKTSGVATNVYSRKTSAKTEKAWSANFKCERFGSCIYARGRYQHPTRPSQGTATFNQVCKHDFNLFYFRFSYVLCPFVFFFIFLWSTRVFPLLLRIPQL